MAFLDQARGDLATLGLGLAGPYRTASDVDVIAELLDLRRARLLELGCGAAWTTRMLMERFAPAHIVATEVDRIQHQKNLQVADLPGVSFRYGGAEAIEDPDGSYDAVLMFKSLHHVPIPVMDQALGEIHRVLRPKATPFLEPVYAGAFNDLLRLFNDEGEVRTAAVAALNRALARDASAWRPKSLRTPGTYADWETHGDHFLKVTSPTRHRQRPVSSESRHLSRPHDPGRRPFRKPHRVDLLRRV